MSSGRAAAAPARRLPASVAMPRLNGTVVVERALKLAQDYPHAPTLAILDQAMADRYGAQLDFTAPDPRAGFRDWLHPPSPFAELLRRAFGMHIEPEEFDRSSAAWHDVIEAFARRYRLRA